MKEAPSKKLPPKAPCGISTGTPTKATNDEILSSLLRINNFDSISSIKDESLDIDISACVPISASIDPAGIMNGNSFSSTDFWRVLDESAQNSQLDVSSSDDGGVSIELNRLETTPIKNYNSSSRVRDSYNECAGIIIKQEPSSFGIFLRPEPPAAISCSPLKKTLKFPTTAEYRQQTREFKKILITTGPIENKKSKVMCSIKEEPPETDLAILTTDRNSIMSSKNFNMFKHLTTVATKTTQVTDQDLPENPILPPQPLFKCLDCNDLILQGQEEFHHHESLAHRILFKCVECDREFEQEAGLKKHQKTHRSVESRNNAWKKCPDCGKSLKLGSMWMHRKIHSDNKKYGCDVCGLKFVQKINLTHHARIHTAEKPYQCPECQKRFQERSHLQRHQKYHAQTRSYRCDKCGKMYKTERCLKVHNLVHLEQRPFACNVCDKSFISNSKLKQHSNIHTGERPFKCNYCPRDFTNFPNWLKHTRRRHKVDHKTGEHLENIPSYCSKKSTKTTKTQKATNNDAKSQNTNDVLTPKTVPTKVTVTKVQAAPIISKVLTETTILAPSAATPAIRTTKVKRERKQLTPKQVQKVPMPIQKLESKNSTGNNFPDLHCLSLTSAEELIMEQALEMEECGLYDPPTPTVGSDNAMSSEAAAALHFKIKSEFPVEIKQEEFINDNGLTVNGSPNSRYTLNNTQGIRLVTSLSNSQLTESTVTATSLSKTSPLLIHQHITPQGNEALVQHFQRPATQAFINHLYLPMAVNMPLLMQQNQSLPSVDTLLFASNPSFFSAKSPAHATAQHNLS